MNNERYRKYLLGLGFDCNDGHRRITLGKNFRLYGGSDRTHKFMQDKVVEFNDHLERRGKTLDEICREEFFEIADKVGIKPDTTPPSPMANLN